LSADLSDDVITPAYTFDYATKAASHQVASPCISVCNINDDSGLCEGCFRTLDEIAVWSQMDNAAKREVWQLISQRSAEFKKP
jgi:uncharacterized protein